MAGIRELLDGKIWEWDLSFRWEWECGNGMGTGMKSLKWEGIGTKNLFPHTSTTNAGSSAEAAATRKAAKYAGTLNASVGLGQKILSISRDDRETRYLFQRISVLIQRFNATLLHESFADENRLDD